MKRTYRLLALVLALLIAVSLFASCGRKTTIVESEGWEDESEFVSQEDSSTESTVSDETSSTSSKDDKTSSNTSSKKQDVDAEKNADGSFNLKGSKVIISAWGGGDKPQPSSATYKEETALISKIEKQFNCKIEFKTVADALVYYGAFTTATMAGTKYADIVKLPGNTSFPNAALSGYLHCLDGYFDWNSVQWIDALTNKALLLNGKHYYLAPASNVLLYNGEVIGFNKKLFEKFGVADPHSYIEKNNWNWATFRETAKAMTRKEGTTQYYGFAYPSVFYYSNDTELVTIDKNGKRTLNVSSPEFLEAIQFTYDLYNVDKVIPEANGDNLFAAGYVAMSLNEAWFYSKKEGVSVAYAPIGPNAKDYNYTNADSLLYAIPKTVKPNNIPAVAAIIEDYLGVYKWRQTPEEIYESMYADEKSAEIISDIHNRALVGGYLPSYYPWVYRNIKWSLYGIDKQQSPQAFAKSVEATGQAEIDVMWSKLKTLE